jgi:hypothetical protein
VPGIRLNDVELDPLLPAVLDAGFAQVVEDRLLEARRPGSSAASFSAEDSLPRSTGEGEAAVRRQALDGERPRDATFFLSSYGLS